MLIVCHVSVINRFPSPEVGWMLMLTLRTTNGGIAGVVAKAQDALYLWLENNGITIRCWGKVDV